MLGMAWPARLHSSTKIEPAICIDGLMGGSYVQAKVCKQLEASVHLGSALRENGAWHPAAGPLVRGALP